VSELSIQNLESGLPNITLYCITMHLSPTRDYRLIFLRPQTPFLNPTRYKGQNPNPESKLTCDILSFEFSPFASIHLFAFSFSIFFFGTPPTSSAALPPRPSGTAQSSHSSPIRIVCQMFFFLQGVCTSPPRVQYFPSAYVTCLQVYW